VLLSFADGKVYMQPKKPQIPVINKLSEFQKALRFYHRSQTLCQRVSARTFCLVMQRVSAADEFRSFLNTASALTWVNIGQ
jgi:hypothetical protein